MALKPTRTVLPGKVPERTTQFVTATFRDQDDEAIVPSSLTLTLYDLASGNVINSRSGVSIRNTNGGTVTANGVLTLELSANDNVVLNTHKATEQHIALLEWSWSANTRFGKHELVITVENLTRVTG